MAQSPLRPFIGVLALLLLAAAVPPALADGATPNPPPLFTRIGVDDDGAVAPGGCAAANPASCTQDVLGLDLVSLEVREAYTSNGTGQAIFLIGFQGGKAGQDNVVTLKLTAGSAQTFAIAGKTEGPYNSTSCSAVVGPYPFPGADEHVKALECRVPYAALGGNGTGTKVTGISVESAVGNTKYDLLPGTWQTTNGQTVPYAPRCSTPTPPNLPSCTPTPPTTPFEYTLKGPAQLLEATLSAASVNLAQGPGLVEIQLASLATNLTQEVAIAMEAPATIQASLDAPTAVLVSNTSKTVALSIVGATRDGMVKLTLTSDLGAYQVLSVSVAAPPSSTCPPVAGNATRAPGCPTTTGTTTNQPAPGFELMPMAALLGLATLSRRRRD
jgi:hypothetical protein